MRARVLRINYLRQDVSYRMGPCQNPERFNVTVRRPDVVSAPGLQPFGNNLRRLCGTIIRVADDFLHLVVLQE